MLSGLRKLEEMTFENGARVRVREVRAGAMPRAGASFTMKRLIWLASFGFLCTARAPPPPPAQVDFSTLSFEEQILVDATTDVLIGPHGAGLMHNVFLPDRGSLIELFVDG